MLVLANEPTILPLQDQVSIVREEVTMTKQEQILACWLTTTGSRNANTIAIQGW
jgi:hypothetical protein